MQFSFVKITPGGEIHKSLFREILVSFLNNKPNDNNFILGEAILVFMDNRQMADFAKTYVHVTS